MARTRFIPLGLSRGPMSKDAERVRKLLVNMAPPGMEQEVSAMWRVIFEVTQDNVMMALQRLGEIPFHFTDKIT